MATSRRPLRRSRSWPASAPSCVTSPGDEGGSLDARRRSFGRERVREVDVLNKPQVNYDRPESEPGADFTQAAGNHNGASNGQRLRKADASPDPFTDRWRSQMKHRRLTEQTPLAVFVQNRLAEFGMKQSEFCR